MKKILFFMFAALAFVACEKDDSSSDTSDIRDENLYAGGDIKFYQNSEHIQTLYFDKLKGGTITIETNVDAFLLGIAVIDEDNRDLKLFYTSTPPDYILKLEDIKKYTKYEHRGCKIVRDGYKKFTLTIEPNCDFQSADLTFCRIKDSKEHGKIADHGGTIIPIYAK